MERNQKKSLLEAYQQVKRPTFHDEKGKELSPDFSVVFQPSDLDQNRQENAVLTVKFF